MASAPATVLYNEFEIYTFDVRVTCARVRWINILETKDIINGGHDMPQQGSKLTFFCVKYCASSKVIVSSLRSILPTLTTLFPEQNRRQLSVNILKLYFVERYMLIDISMKGILWGLTGNKLALLRVKIWHRTGGYSLMTKFMGLYDYTSRFC